MELRVLRYFLGVARAGNVTGAAAVLHVTQPTLSRQIAELEEELGAKLFFRKKHRMELTPDGVLLRQRAEEILDMVDKTAGEFSSGEKAVKGEVHIGGGMTQAMRLVARIVRELRAEHPQVRYNVQSGNAMDVAERLDKGLLDFGIIIQPTDLAKYDYLELPIRDTWGVIMPKDSPLARKKVIRRKDLLNVPVISSRWSIRASNARTTLADWFGEDFEKVDVVMTYNLVSNAAIMVEEGIGYAVVLGALTNINTLCFRPLEPKAESKLYFIWKKRQVFSPAARTFLEKAREMYGQGRGSEKAGTQNAGA